MTRPSHDALDAVDVGCAVTREPLCPIAYCPAPDDPDWHRCLICDRAEVHHHDTGAKGMGGGKEHHKVPHAIVALCPQHHEMVTLQYSDAILKDIYVGGIVGKVDLYRIWDIHNVTIFEKIVRREEPKDASPASWDLTPQEWVIEEEGEAGSAAAEGSAVNDSLDGSPGVRSGISASPSAAASPTSPGGPPAISSPHPPVSHDGWRAADLSLEDDEGLAEQFHRYYGMSGMLRLEAYRRIEAYRLKYAAVAGESWVDKAQGAFDLSKPALDAYSRAWRAFEGAVDDRPEFLDALQEMGGGAWQVMGRAQAQRWPEMVEIALSVVADTGFGKGLPARVSARAQEEGVLPPSFRRYTVAQLRDGLDGWTAETLDQPLSDNSYEIIGAFLGWLEKRDAKTPDGG